MDPIGQGGVQNELEYQKWECNAEYEDADAFDFCPSVWSWIGWELDRKNSINILGIQ